MSVNENYYVYCPYCQKEHPCKYLWTTNARRITWQQKIEINNFRCPETNGVFKINNINTYD